MLFCLSTIVYAGIAKQTDTKSDSLAGHRFGIGTEVSLTLDDGQWTDVDGGRLWIKNNNLICYYEKD